MKSNSRSARAARGEQNPRARRRRRRNVSDRLAHLNENLRYLKDAHTQSTLTRARTEWKSHPVHQRLNAIKARRDAEQKQEEANEAD